MGGRGSYSYGSGVTDTKGGKKLIQAGGGGNLTLLELNASEGLQTKYDRSGFERLYGGNDVQNAVLGSYADQLTRLESRFGAAGDSKKPVVIVTNEPASDAIAAVGFNPANPADQTLFLNSAYLGKISPAVAAQQEATAKKWAAANDGSLKSNAYYSVTHEYGHMLHNAMYAKAKESGYTGTRNEWIENANREVLNIAKTRYNVKKATGVSRYGETNGRERFAETFASSQLGGKTAMAKAMRVWLKQKGF